MNKPLTFPPAVWLTLSVALAAWMQDSFPFPEHWWSPGVVIVLGTVAKLLELYLMKPPSVQESTERGYLWTGKAWKFFLGG